MAKGYMKSVFQTQLRLQLEHISIQELAQRLGKPISTVRKWLSGFQSPNRATMQQCCLKLGIDTSILDVQTGNFHEIWKRQCLTYEVLDRRYRELRKKNELFEAQVMLNVTAVLLLRELSQQGHPLQLRTTAAGDAVLVATAADTLFQNIYIRVEGAELAGIKMSVYSMTAGTTIGRPASISSENIGLLLQSCASLKGNER